MDSKRAETLYELLGEIDDIYIEQAEHCRPKRAWPVRSLRRLGAAAALAAALLLAFQLWYSASPVHGTTPAGDAGGGPADTASYHIFLSQVPFNPIDSVSDGARIWYDPTLYHTAVWGEEELTGYYGNALAVPYVPEGLTAAPGNGTARVILAQDGTVAEDTVWLQFYHDYYPDGSPMLTEVAAAELGFTVTVSKLGLLGDCLYLLPGNEVQTFSIGETPVTFGWRSMPYGPYDPDTHDPAGFYDFYTAEWEKDGICFQLLSHQLGAEETVKIAAAMILGRDAVVVEP